METGKLIKAAYFLMDLTEDHPSKCCRSAYLIVIRHFLFQCPEPECADLAETCSAILDWRLR